MANDQQTYNFVMNTFAGLANDYDQIANFQEQMAHQASEQVASNEVVNSMRANVVRLRKAAALAREVIAAWRRHNARDAQRVESPRRSPGVERKVDLRRADRER